MPLAVEVRSLNHWTIREVFHGWGQPVSLPVVLLVAVSIFIQDECL